MGEDQSLQQMMLGQGYTHIQKNRVGTLYHIPYKKINSKWIYLNISAKTIKLLEKYTGVNLRNTGLGNRFLDMTTKEKNRSSGLIEIKNFCAKDVTKKIKRQPNRMGENICKSYT